MWLELLKVEQNRLQALENFNARQKSRLQKVLQEKQQQEQDKKIQEQMRIASLIAESGGFFVDDE